MKESIAKTKQCPHLANVKALENLNVVLMHVIAAHTGNSSTMDKAVRQVGRLIANNENNLCQGSNCLMWEPEYKEERKELKPDEPAPKGDGWQKSQRIAERPNVVWVRHIPIDQGDCGLKTKETGCYATCG